jgi:hypothetical protein
MAPVNPPDIPSEGEELPPPRTNGSSKPAATPPPGWMAFVVKNWKPLGALLLVAISAGLAGKDYITSKVSPYLPQSTDSATTTPDKPPLDSGALPNEVPGLKLPKSQSIVSTTRVIKIQAISDGPVKWLVFSRSGVTFDIYNDKKLLYVFPNDVEEDITVYAYTIVGGLPSETARTVITVSRSGPVTPPPTKPPPSQPPPSHPPPQPDVPPLIINPGVPLSITLVAEVDRNPDVVLDSVGLRTAWRKRGDDVWDLKPDSVIIKEAGLSPYIAKVLAAGGKLPIFILQQKVDNGIATVLSYGQVPTTEAEMVAEHNKALAKVKPMQPSGSGKTK